MGHISPKPVSISKCFHLNEKAVKGYSLGFLLAIKAFLPHDSEAQIVPFRLRLYAAASVISIQYIFPPSLRNSFLFMSILLQLVPPQQECFALLKITPYPGWTFCAQSLTIRSGIIFFSKHPHTVFLTRATDSNLVDDVSPRCPRVIPCALALSAKMAVLAKAGIV